MRRLLLILLFVLAVPSTASATTIIGDPGYQEWVDAVTRIPTPEGELEVVTGEDCRALGCAAGRLMELSPFAGETRRKVFLHELGHIFDEREMTVADRESFIAITGKPLYGWWDAPRFDYGRMAGEWFADTYQICALAKRIRKDWEYTVGSTTLKGRIIQKGCWLIRYAAAT